MTEINKELFDKELLVFDKMSGKYTWVSPKILTKSVYTEEGVPLDDLLGATPDYVLNILNEILEGAPKNYDTFLEIAEALGENKDSITEIFNEIKKRIKRPEGGNAGQVLKLDEKGEIVFADDNDTIYTHPKSHEASMIDETEEKRFVSDEEKKTWNNKLDENSDLGENKVTYDWTYYEPPQRYNEFIASMKKEENSQLPLGELLSYQSEEIAQLMQAKNGAEYVATLDEKGKIPIDQLPDEALLDTTYDLSPYLLTDDATEVFALKTEIPVIDLSPYAKTEDLDVYAKTEDLDNYQHLEKRGAVDGYASLGEDGKVPKEQIDFDDWDDFVKNEDLEYATIEDISDLMI